MAVTAPLLYTVDRTTEEIQHYSSRIITKYYTPVLSRLCSWLSGSAPETNWETIEIVTECKTNSPDVFSASRMYLEQYVFTSSWP